MNSGFQRLIRPESELCLLLSKEDSDALLEVLIAACVMCIEETKIQPPRTECISFSYRVNNYLQSSKSCTQVLARNE